MTDKNLSGDPFDPFTSDEERQERLQYQTLKSKQNVLLLSVVGGVILIIIGLFVLSNQLPFLAFLNS